MRVTRVPRPRDADTVKRYSVLRRKETRRLQGFVTLFEAYGVATGLLYPARALLKSFVPHGAPLLRVVTPEVNGSEGSSVL